MDVSLTVIRFTCKWIVQTIRTQEHHIGIQNIASTSSNAFQAELNELVGAILDPKWSNHKNQVAVQHSVGVTGDSMCGPSCISNFFFVNIFCIFNFFSYINIFLYIHNFL